MAEAAATKLDVKRSVLRVVGLEIVTLGLYYYYWFYVTRQHLKEELGSDDNVGLQTLGLIVPILQAFILYWLYRDISKLREQQNLQPFSAVLYIALPYGLIFGGVAILLLTFLGFLGAAANGHKDSAAAILAAGGIAFLLFIILLVAGGICQLVFYCLAISKLNEYWDVKAKGAAKEAGFGRGEIIVIVIGLILLVLNIITPRHTRTYESVPSGSYGTTNY